MSSLRCTAKLLKRLKIEKPGDPPRPTNALGDWFANIIYTRQGHFVILVSERSLLPILTTARDLDNLVPRFLNDLAEVLRALKVPTAKIDREIEQMQPIYFGRTNSRSVLGSMNDYVQNFRFMLDLRPGNTLFDWSLHFAETPCGAVGYDQPKTLAPQLLNNPHGFEVINGGKA